MDFKNKKIISKLNNKNIMFRFVPTMSCNLQCRYCFLSEDTKHNSATMFDNFSVTAWIEAMANFKDYDVEFYMWGGEPFILDGTYEIIAGFSKYKHVKWARIDHNMTMVDKIIEKCPTNKVKILASWHTEKFNFEKITQKVLKLKSEDMLGMLNFVASYENLVFIKEEGLDLHELIRFFMDKGVFMNIAADFRLGTNIEYKKFIVKYTTFEDWDYIHGLKNPINRPCDAGASFFTVDYDGHIKTCADNSIVGNFFNGQLNRRNINCSSQSCNSLISYCHRLDNDFSPVRHLEDYILRNTIHRRKTGVLGTIPSRF